MIKLWTFYENVVHSILFKYADDNNLLVPKKPILTFVSSLLTLLDGLLIT